MQAIRPATRRRRGFTMIELIVTLAIAAIVLSAAKPSFSALVEKQRLDGASSHLVSDIQFARAEAARRGEGVRLSLHGTSGGCYLLHTGAVADCDCSDGGASSCTGSAEALKSVGLGTDVAVRLSGNVPSMLFSPLHGTTSPAGTLTLTGGSGRSIRHVVNLMGRVRTCSPIGSAPAVSGYAVC